MIRIIGEPLLAPPSGDGARSRIATIIPRDRLLITIPGIHATQRQAWIDLVNEQRQQGGQSPLGDAEAMTMLVEQCVDLIVDGDVVLIRPNPDNMELAFEADELLQQLVSKRKIKFLHVLNDKVRQAIQRRGEAWRIHPLPKSPEEMLRMIQAARIAIAGRPIYFYNATTGTRWLTFASFASLSEMDDDELRRHLQEIARHSAMRGIQGLPEVAFFMAGHGLGPADFRRDDLVSDDSRVLRSVYAELLEKFRRAVPPQFHVDDPQDAAWRNRMIGALIGHRDDVISEESLLGLSSEFFMQIEWLPGARLDEGELIFDSVLDELAESEGDEQFVASINKVRGLIFNFLQEYGDLEYVNIGRVIGSLCRRSPLKGRRDVFVAQIKQRGSAQEVLQIIRMQKWGVRERLDEGRDLLRAMIESEEYTEYILDRRLGCRQLGMNLPARVFTRKLNERYTGRQKHLEGITIWSPYFQRDYISGLASDKMPLTRLRDGAYSVAFAHLLGRAAAPNIIVGRCNDDGSVLFDDGDEVVIEEPSRDGNGVCRPVDIIVADHTGTFSNYESDLRDMAGAYAGPINRRWKHLMHPEAFADCYIQAFVDRFRQIQEDYRRRKRAFDTLFKHRHYTRGSLAYRWERVLRRLNEADPAVLAERIRKNIRPE